MNDSINILFAWTRRVAEGIADIVKNEFSMQVASDFNWVKGDSWELIDSSHKEMFIVSLQESILSISREGFFESFLKLFWIDTNVNKSFLLALSQFWYFCTFISNILHVVPPLIRVNFEEKLLSNLLIQDELAIGWFYVFVVECTIGTLHVAIWSWAIFATFSVVDEIEVDVVFDLGIKPPEILNKTVGVAIIGLEVEGDPHFFSLGVVESDLHEHLCLLIFNALIFHQ